MILEEFAVLVYGASDVEDADVEGNKDATVGPTRVVELAELEAIELAAVPTGAGAREVELCECSSSSQSQGPVP